MPVFKYIARDKWKNMRKGKLEADTMPLLVRQLREKGFFVTSVSPIPEKTAQKRKFSEITIFKSKVKPKELMIFSRQFAVMLDSGMDVIECLRILEEQSDNPTLRGVISEVKEDVEEGKDLAQAFSRHPKVFNHLYISMIEAAQSSGSYGTVLSNIATEIEKSQRIKHQVKSALMPPLMTLIFAIVLSFCLIKFVVPTFMDMYGSVDKLPKPTQMLIAANHAVEGIKGLILILSVILLVIAFKLFIGSEKGRYIWDKVKLKSPIFGHVLKKIAIASFSRTLSLLLMSGVDYLESLEIVSKAAKNKVLSEVLKKTRESVRKGESLSKPLIDSGIFYPLVIQMIHSGEKSGQVPEMLDRIADIYEEEVDRSVENLSAALTPILTVLIGVIVGGLLLGLYMPVFSMGEMVGG